MSLQEEGFQQLSKVDEALRVFLDAVGHPKIHPETLQTRDANGRILAEDIVADRYIPAVDRAIMDGYGVRAEDVQNASESGSVQLIIVGESRMGEVCRQPVKAGEAVAVATGSMVPPGADTIAVIELTRKTSQNRVAVFEKSAVGHGISRRGEDVSPGTKVLPKGHLLRPQDIGILGSLGRSRVKVARKPRIGIISTGNELSNSPNRGNPTIIVDIDRPILGAMVQESGGDAVDMGIVKDERRLITRSLRQGLRKCDAVVVTAGSSVGKKDLVPSCINKLGKPGIVVHGVAMRPAMPTCLAVVKRKPIMSLPGVPVSAIIAFRIFGRPLLARLQGTVMKEEPSVKAHLEERIEGPRNLRKFVRVVVRKSEDGFVAEPLKLQRSSVLMSMVSANGIVVVPEGVESVEAGQLVHVTLIGEIEP